MTISEIFDLFANMPQGLKDIGLLALIFSLIEVSPLKLNPWRWLKAFYQLPARLDKLEHEFNDDRAFRWRQMILNRARRIEQGEKMRYGEWEETMDTIGRYEKYCDACPDFRNGFATDTIEFMKDAHKEVMKNGDYAPDLKRVKK